MIASSTFLKRLRVLAYNLFSLLIIFLSSGNAFGQETTVTGKVTDNKGENVSGVSVQVKGTVNGTSTDKNGDFSLNVSSLNSTLVFSNVGYQNQEVSLGGRTNVSVVLQTSSRELDQVVVVGYGTQLKRDVTGATASVKGTELVKQPVLTATQAIQGKVAGVQIINNGQPGTNPTVRIRGTGTLLAGADPLFVVDGVITTDITNINTADILSIDVLKDASSTAIYGARGANGVIIITTRQGSGKLKVSYNGTIGIEDATNLVKMANSQQYAAYISASTFGLTSTDEIVAKAGTPSGTSTDWYGEILRNALQQRHNVSLSGSNETDRYFLSVGYEDDKGIVIDNDYRRMNVRFNNEYKINNKLRLGTLASYSNANDRQVNLGGAYNDAYRASPLIPAFVNGKYGNVSQFQRVVGNPILDIKDDNHKFIHNRFEGSAFIELKPFKFLTLRSSFGADLEFLNEKDYHYAFQPDTTTFIVTGGSQGNANSSLAVTDTKTFRWVWDNTATFSRRYDKHNITVLAGTTSEQYNTSYNNASRQNVPSDPSLWYLNVGNVNSSQNNSSQNKFTRVSYLGRINYSYNDRYLFTGTMRADASSVFPSNNRWGYFPSVGAGWILSKENFLQHQEIFQTLKIRGSWGQAGNDNIPTNSFIPTLLSNQNYPFPVTQVNGVAIAQLKDQNLKWETTTEWDVALEFSALQNRLTGEVGYYTKKTKDALIDVLISATSGSQPDFNSPNPQPAGSVLTNAASIQNSGEEVALGWNDKINKNFSYHINGNITFNKNKVVGLNGGQPILDGQVNNDRVTKTDNGHEVGSFYVRKVLGVFQSQSEIDNYIDANGNKLQGSANQGDLKYAFNPDGTYQFVYAGSYQPKAYYGISLGFTFKDFDFSVDGYGTYGGKVYNGKRQVRINLYDNIEASVAKNAWPATKNNPGPNQGNQPSSTYFIESGSYIRINNATVGYTMPARIVKKLRIISNLRIYATGQNIFTDKKYSGFTPELPGTSPTNAGIELNTYPTSRVVAIGLNVGFN